jgi:hypothetical protein
MYKKCENKVASLMGFIKLKKPVVKKCLLKKNEGGFTFLL